MNYYQYKKRVPETRKGSDYVKPVLLVLIVVAIIFALWKLFGALFGGDDTESNTDQAKVNVEVDTGDAEVMIADGEDWEAIPGLIDVYETEKVRTKADSRVSMTFFDGSIARLDEESQVVVDTLTEESSSSEIELTLEDGNLWVNGTKATSLASQFTVKTDTFTVKADDSDRFALAAPDSLYVLEGEVEVDILDGTEIVKSLEVSEDEQLIASDSVVSDLSSGLEKEVLFAIDDSFKTSNWFRWNQQNDGVEVGSEDEEADETNNDEENTDENTDDEETTDEEEDGNGPSIPQITSPGKNGSEVTLTKVDQFISGTVSENTEKVIVNEYTLNQYVPGSEEFTYKASATIGNLKVGSNTFTVTAVDEDGNKSKVAEITLILPQKVFDDAGLEEDEEKEDEEETSTGGVSITSPNGGSNLTTSETSFVISGTVPSETARVMVNGYRLQGFTAGGTTFKYNANTTIGSLKVGQKNTYTVEAYDANDRKIGSASMTIDVSENASAGDAGAETPSADAMSASITMPTTAAAYDTTLNQITLGGSVTGSPEAVFVNGNKVEDYTPGTGAWKMTVTLNPGENNFNVYAEKEGQSSSSDSLTVTYKN